MVPTTSRESQAPPRRRRGQLWVGLALVLAGLALLGYVGWQLLGTNVVSQRKQQAIVEHTQQEWSPQARVSLRAKADAEAARGYSAEALLRIPALGADYVVPVQEGTSDRVLSEGFGHFDGSAGPGQVGNYGLAAHRVTHGEPLRDMPRLRPGDTVVVETRSRTYTYRLDTDPRDLVVSFSSTWVIDPVPRNPVAGGVQPDQRAGGRLITLTTCSELFHTDDRMIAFGHLVRSRPR